MTNVIDISAYQMNGNDYSKLKSEGIKAVIVKAGEGQDVYASFDPEAKGVTGAGIPIGVYWFSRAYTTDMAKAEANRVCDVIKNYKVGLPVFIDFEYDSLAIMQNQGVTPNKTLITNIHLVFCKTVEERGYKAGYYTNPDFLSRFVDATKLKEYTKWIACWGSYPYKDCDLWQSGVGRLQAIGGGKVDTDLDQIISGAFATMVDEATSKLKTKEEKPKEEKNKKTDIEIAVEVIQGKWSVFPERKRKIEAAGYNYSTIQNLVDQLLTGKIKATQPSTSKPATKKKTNNQIAVEVIQGKWGAGAERRKKLTAAGYDYSAVQKLVDEMMKKNK